MWEVTQICIPLLVVGSLTQVMLKWLPPLVRAGLRVILSNLCLNICLVPHCTYNGPIGPTFWLVTQISIPLLVVGSLSTKVILKGSPPLLSAGILVFVEYLSGPLLYVEWTNWSNILASYSDMYTSPGNR